MNNKKNVLWVKKIIILLMLIITLSSCGDSRTKFSGNSCTKFSGEYWLYAYMASDDAIKCHNNGCKVKTIKCYNDMSDAIDTGWCEFECVSACSWKDSDCR